jgi:hypothetical protein
MVITSLNVLFFPVYLDDSTFQGQVQGQTPENETKTGGKQGISS